MTLPPDPSQPTSQRKRRASRYQRAQERREAQRRSDQRFYNAIFSLIGACVLVVLGLAMIASSGQVPGVGGGTVEPVTYLGLTLIEIIGLLAVAVVAFIWWKRIRRR